MTQQERDLLIAEKRWAKEKPIKEREFQLKEEKRKLRAEHNPLRKLSTSKLLIFFLFINCTIIELFTGWVTVKSFDLATMTLMMPDFTPLVTLIGAVVSEVIGFAIYAIKAAKENTVGGIVYEQAMAQMQETPPVENDNSAVG